MKYLYLLVSVLILLTLLAVLMMENYKNLVYFFVAPKKFQKAILGHYEHNLQEYNRKKEENKEANNVIVSYDELRRRIFKGFMMIVIVLLYTGLTTYVQKKYLNVHYGETELIFLQMLGVFLVLWALLSKMGWEIQTIKGLTLPEYINNLWFRTLNVISGHLVLFGYFYRFYNSWRP